MFLSHSIVFKGKNRAKVMYFIKLAILIFGCPGNTHVTNFTRMPHMHYRCMRTVLSGEGLVQTHQDIRFYKPFFGFGGFQIGE